MNSKNFKKYQKLLEQFVKFQSVSTDPKFKDQIDDAVLWLKRLFTTNGFKVDIWIGKNSNPIVFAEYILSSEAKTVLIYGHYDVQPALLKDGWKSDPFTLISKKGKLVGRGVVDNKGQILAHIFTAFDLIEKKQLNYNLKFIIEGNEETGNEDIAGLMEKNKKSLACDILIVSDGELTNNKPTIEMSLRGGFNCLLTFKTAKSNLHSGIFGGAIPNAGTEMVKFLIKIFNEDNSIKIKDFYLGVDKIKTSELSNNKKLAKEAKDLTKLAGVKSLLCQKGVDFYTQTGLIPTIQITGLKTGYIDPGFANIIPADSEVRLNFRIVASQKANNIARIFSEFVEANVPEYIEYKLSFYGLHNPIKVNDKNSYIPGLEKILEKVYGTKVVRKNVGGAIPFVGDVKSILGVDTLMVPMANEDCNMHGISENFDIVLVKKALLFSKMFLSSRYSHFYMWNGKPTVVRNKKT